MPPIDPIDHSVSQYALSVVAGDVIAGDLVRMACERHLLDLETARDRGFVFRPDLASGPIKFASLLTHNKGPKAGQPIRLEPWQKFRIGSVFGWVNEETGMRRFRSSYHQVGKKNGKTTDTTVPMMFHMFMDGEASPEAYCAATSRDQAGLLFNDIKKMVKKSPLLGSQLRLVRSEIGLPANGGSIKTVSRESKSIDGINPSFLARDEMHRWTDRELAETLVESGISRAQPIDWAITTAGHDLGGLCGESRIYAERVLRGDVVDDEFFAYVAEPPGDCDPLDPVAWAMGNPNLGVSKPEAAVRKAAEKAMMIAGQMPNFRRFHLNLWTESADAWIDRDSWDRGLASAPFDVRELFGLPAYAAFDLSKTTDTTAIHVAIPKGKLIYLVNYSFLPSGPNGFIKRAQAEKKEYIGWREQGWLEVHDGGRIDNARLVRVLKAIKQNFDLREVAYDPWGAADLVAALDDLRFSLVEHMQGFKSMSEPMKEVEALVIENRIRHGGNPVLAWQVSNVAQSEDASGNVKPDKRKSQGRIDAAVAMIMAVGRATAHQPKKTKTREVETL